MELGGRVVWTSVTLADGTSLKVTADHPVQPVPPDAEARGKLGPWNMSEPIQAGQLKPGVDHLLVLKVSPVEVQSSVLHEEVGNRIALSIQQPERHTIFVASPGQQIGCLQTMAVESSAAISRPALDIKNTFLNVKETFASFEQHMYYVQQGQSNSAPASIHPKTRSARSASPPKSPTSPKSPLSPKSPSMLQVLNRLSDLKGSSSSLSLSNPSSTSDRSSGKSATVVIGGPYVPVLDQDGRATGVQVANPENGVALRSIIGLRNTGLRSLGSVAHQHCDCKPCAFENRRQFYSTRPCNKGSLCEFCHEPHQTELRKAKRQSARKKRREAWNPDLEDGSEPPENSTIDNLDRVSSTETEARVSSTETDEELGYQ
jgi:hypothetical protein